MLGDAQRSVMKEMREMTLKTPELAAASRRTEQEDALLPALPSLIRVGAH